MSDNKNKGAKEPPVEFDSESTIELDISKLGKVTSTSTDEHLSDNDSDKTIDSPGEIDDLNAGETDEYMPETAERRDESDDMFDLDISDLPDEATGDEDEFLAGNSTPVTDEPPRPESPDDEGLQPVIELTEEMLDEPEGRDNQAVEDIADDPDTPGLTTTEINSVSAATATAGDIGEDEKIPEIEVEIAAIEAVEDPVAEPATKPGSRGSNMIPLLFGILGIAVGGFGAWMAFDATGKVADLERRIQILSTTGNHSQDHDITDIQQRLAKVERRLTGTPTLEAAAPLGVPPTVESAPLESVEEAVSQPLPVTPQTSISSAPSNGDWVVNISSHANEDLALRENARLQSLGLNSEIHTARVRERTWYRIQITGFASKEEAKAKLKDLQQYSGIKGAWIGKQ